MTPESIMEAVRHVKAPGSAWFRAYPSILNHIEISIRYRTDAGDEGGFEKQILYSQVDEATCLEACRDLWLQAAAVMFDERNRSFAGQTRAARPIFAKMAKPEGVNVRIG